MCRRTRTPVSLRATCLVALLAASMLVALPGAAGQDQSEELQHFRAWSVGDHWSYEMYGDPEDGAAKRGTIVYRVLGTERIHNDMFYREEKHPETWKSHNALHVRQWANQSNELGQDTVTIHAVQDRYYRIDDHARARNEARADYTFAAGGLGTQERIYEFFGPQVQMFFPFAVGDQWRAFSNVRAHNPGNDCGTQNRPPCNATDDRVFTFTVLGTEDMRVTIDGKSKTFHTYKVKLVNEMRIDDTENLRARPYQVWWWSPEVCNTVREEEYRSDGTLERTQVLTDYGCKGRDARDPTYSIYDKNSLSSTRFDGELSVPPVMQTFLTSIESLEDQQGLDGDGGNSLQIGEGLPAPGGVLVAVLLVGLVAIWRRRPT